MAQPVVEISGLTRTYNGVCAVDNLSLTIERGESFGFLGPNGAGKTTTIKMLTGFLRPDRGSIRIMGYDLATEGIEVKRRVGLVPDEYGLYDDLTAADHLRFYGSLLGMSGRELEEAIERSLGMVELREHATARVKSFSHGMRQRLVIAQALMGEPEVLFLDEPTSGLDPIGAREVRQIIKKMTAAGMTLFISSHLLFEVQEMCKSVGVIHRGRLLRKDTIENLSSLFKDKMGRQLFLLLQNPSPELYSVVSSVRGVDSVTTDGAAYRIRISDPEAQFRVAAEVVRAGGRILSFYEVNPSLEDLFMDLLGVGR
ncbi:MAG: ABC transporter ATP-binding protein [Thermoplasmata archaeon]